MVMALSLGSIVCWVQLGLRAPTLVFEPLTVVLFSCSYAVCVLADGRYSGRHGSACLLQLLHMTPVAIVCTLVL